MNKNLCANLNLFYLYISTKFNRYEKDYSNNVLAFFDALQCIRATKFTGYKKGWKRAKVS